MQITFVVIFGIFIFTLAQADVDVRLPVHRPEQVDDRNPENVNVLLSTLLEMHHNLLGQISLLEDKLKTSLPIMEKSEIKHMVQHFTAQKNNIELSIQQIQANDGMNMPQSRSNGKDVSAEPKTIPSLLNIFRRNPVPTTPEQINQNIGYSLPNPPHYGQQPQYVYQGSPPVAPPLPPSIQLVNDPNAFPQQQQQQQVYVSPDQASYHYAQEQPQQQVIQQYVPAAPQSPQVVQYQQQQAVPQYQQQPILYANTEQSPIQYQEQPNQLPEQVNQDQQYVAVPQIVQEPQYDQQAQLQLQQQQQVQPQPPPVSTQPQYQFESVFRPSNVPVRRPQTPEYDTQRYQTQAPFGQKEGVFVYYPNGVIADDKDRPTIANRVGQAFDRFGQAIQSNFGFRQPETNPTIENGSTSLIPRSEPLPTTDMEKKTKLSSAEQQKPMATPKKTIRLGSEDHREEKEKNSNS